MMSQKKDGISHEITVPPLGRPGRDGGFLARPGSLLTDADGRFLRLKLPPYRFSFKKSAIHPGGGI